MMKVSKLLFLSLMIAESVSAQILLTPKVSGTCENQTVYWRCFISWGNTLTSWRYNQFADSFSVRDGKTWSSSDWYEWTTTYWWTSFNGIFEFDIENTQNGALFPPPWMTSNGWTAQLENLVVIEVYNTNIFWPSPGVDLLNLADSAQDGTISASDCNTGTFITNLSSTFPPLGSSFTADVTDALRHDLFGPIRYPTSGFILKPVSWKEQKSLLKWSDNAKIRITVFSETPTPSPTASAEPTTTPTPENPCDTLRVRIRMPSSHFSPGDPCSCHLVICNPGPESYTDIPLFVILDVFGNYLFWPDYTSFDYSILANLPLGPTIVEVLPMFSWPEGAGTVMDGVQWIAGMTDPHLTILLGDFDIWEFSWGS